MKIMTQKEILYRLFFNIVVTGALLGMIFYVHKFNPVVYVFFTSEDYFGEYATFVNYILAVILLCAMMRSNRNFFKLGYLLLTLTLFIIGMEEISWGQHILNLDTPSLIAKYNFQGELAIHNMIDTGFPLTTFFCYCVSVWVVGISFLASRNTSFHILIKKWGIPVVPIYLLPYFAISLYVFHSSPFTDSSEIGEELLSLAFVLLASDIVFLSNKNFWISKLSWVVQKVLLFAVIFIVTAFFVWWKPGPYNLRNRFQVMAAVLYPQNGLDQQAQELFEYMVDNKSLRTPETYFEYVLFLKKRDHERFLEVLQSAIDEQYAWAKKRPHDPKPFRQAGILMKMNNQNTQAHEAFEQALTKDLLRFDTAEEGWQKAWALRSMGETYLYMENYPAALKVLQEALTLTTENKYKNLIQSLIKRVNAKMSNVPSPVESF